MKALPPYPRFPTSVQLNVRAEVERSYINELFNDFDLGAVNSRRISAGIWRPVYALNVHHDALTCQFLIDNYLNEKS